MLKIVSEARRRKRKQHDLGEELDNTFGDAVNLEMSDTEADGKGGDDSAGTDEEAEEFPEIDAQSSSEVEGDEDEDEANEEVEEVEDGEDDDESEEDSEEDYDSDTGLRVLPESKTVISDITGHPKRVYPEIEPVYDSDSSTEDARAPLFFSPARVVLTRPRLSGSQPYWKRTLTLV